MLNSTLTLDLLRLLGVAVLVLANGFFVAAEFALVSVRRTRVEELLQQGRPGARAVKRALADPDRFIAATQLGITIASLGLGWLGEPALAHFIEPVVNLLLRLIGMRAASGHELVHSVEELKMLVEASEESGVLEDSERDMLHAVFDFGGLTAREVMVPRTEMIAVEADAPLPVLIQLAITHSFSKFPVYEGDLDHIIGLVHVKDLVRVQHDERKEATVRGLMREPLVVPETIRLDLLLKEFRLKRLHLAIALDEYGGTAGLVTLDDLMQQIVGEVRDSFGQTAPEIQRLPDGSALLDGLMPIADVNEAFNLNLKDEFYDTIAGLVLGRLGRMPRVGDSVQADSVRLKVEALDGLRIARLSLLHLRADGKSSPPQ